MYMYIDTHHTSDRFYHYHDTLTNSKPVTTASFPGSYPKSVRGQFKVKVTHYRLRRGVEGTNTLP